MLSNILLIFILETFDLSDLLSFIFVSKKIYNLICLILRNRLNTKENLNLRELVFLNLDHIIVKENEILRKIISDENIFNSIKDIVIFSLIKLKLELRIQKSLFKMNRYFLILQKITVHLE